VRKSKEEEVRERMEKWKSSFDKQPQPPQEEIKRNQPTPPIQPPLPSIQPLPTIKSPHLPPVQDQPSQTSLANTTKAEVISKYFGTTEDDNVGEETDDLLDWVNSL